MKCILAFDSHMFKVDYCIEDKNFMFMSSHSSNISCRLNGIEMLKEGNGDKYG
jgi:hypothetical protein